MLIVVYPHESVCSEHAPDLSHLREVGIGITASFAAIHADFNDLRTCTSLYAFFLTDLT